MRSFVIMVAAVLFYASHASAQNLSRSNPLESTQFSSHRVHSTSTADHIELTFKKERVPENRSIQLKVNQDHQNWNFGDVAFTLSSSEIWKIDRASGEASQVIGTNSDIILGDIEFDSMGNLYFLDKGIPQEKSGNIYVFGNDNRLYRLLDPGSILVFNPFGIHVSNDGYLYGTGWVTNEFGSTAIYYRFNLQNETWELFLCVANINPFIEASFPSDIHTLDVFGLDDFVVFTDQTIDGVLYDGSGVYFTSKNFDCLNSGFGPIWSGLPFVQPVSILPKFLVNPILSIVVADNTILPPICDFAAGVVIIDFTTDTLSIEGALCGEPFEFISDVADDVVPYAFFVADEGARKLFWIRQTEQLRWDLFEVIEFVDDTPEGIAVYFGEQGSTSNIALENSFNHKPSRQLTLRQNIIQGRGNGMNIDLNNFFGHNMPEQVKLFQNFPNPFNPTTLIRYNLKNASRVTLKIFNVLGETVATLLEDEFQPAGPRVIRWDGKDQFGRKLPSGIYFYRLRAGPFSSVRRMSLVR